MSFLVQHQKDKLQPLVWDLNSQLMRVSLDNIKILNQNKLLVEYLKQVKAEVEEKTMQLKSEVTESSIEFQDQVKMCKGENMKLELRLKQETYAKEILEKEMQKIKSDKVKVDLDLKLQTRTFKQNLEKAQSKVKLLEGKIRNLEEEKSA